MFGQDVVDLYHRTVDESLASLPFDASSREAFSAWQTDARERLGAIIGALPSEPANLKPTREVVEETDAYVRERLVYETRPGMRVPGYLLTPKGLDGPAPAVLCLHGHSRGGKDNCLEADTGYAAFAPQFAEQGVVAFCPDQIGFGERVMPEGKVTYNVLVHGLNMLGETLIGWRYWDLLCAMEIVSGLDTVREDRIGVMGLSLGGEMTMFLAAMQERIAAACVACYLTSHKSTFLDSPHCTCGHLWDLARHFEHVDIAALIAPRPLFLEAGSQDPSFPSGDAEALVEELRSVYTLHGKSDVDIGVHVHGGGHEINGSQSIPWMIERLS
ncbi:hypothetical protein HN371_22910 [Candidatus Poribacteria bacterium]|jgi:dienelactone hydrolase|nr:hypothetical protein [Candidatus Poribacteria bacterium]MBT5534136.1 hypothetical protein [Candidatus Poribacteria bacterium]MBT5710187.1 hypothetical protein [Candidatus Poribacteria bacterium]MBT7805469.1 hypothetical protein [Candidatus Poribacteria bacterium]